MGGGSSTPRTLTLEQEQSTGVVKVSESVARRLVGKPEPITDNGSGTTSSSPSISPDDLNLEINKIQARYDKRIKALEKQNKELHQTSTEQFARAVEEVEKKFLKTTAAPICDDLQNDVMKCYQENGKETINCSQLVKSYSSCVQQQRESILTKKDCQPCLLAQMARGPCGDHFVKAYDCYLDDATGDNKDDCGMLYLAMKECWDQNPSYGYQKIIDRAYDDGPSAKKASDKNNGDNTASKNMDKVSGDNKIDVKMAEKDLSAKTSKETEQRKQL